ncbi:SUKH-3 domain-containing protein [Streptomyces sp. 7N604]|uniref:SUKH-3 domain-containing protein n=1 Tax=Streptomyces sp. 7N604 TaxID=3457415 RepID=UPI003FD614C7
MPRASDAHRGVERVLHESDEGFEIHQATRRFITEFGGLEINQQGPGKTMAWSASWERKAAASSHGLPRRTESSSSGSLVRDRTPAPGQLW